MNLIGKPTINPLIFYSGKISGYVIWVLYALSIIGVVTPGPFAALKIISYVIAFAGLFITITSLLNLGDATRFGLPSETTSFKQSGLYRFSRNPMYVGFDLLTLASMIGSANIFVIILGVYSITIYHLIILGEEKFMEERFGKVYTEYKRKVRRYV
jgi:protein-S-isoprenylcysteine O-methyltransferase Ste14